MLGRVNAFYMALTGTFVKTPPVYEAIVQSMIENDKAFVCDTQWIFNRDFDSAHVDVIPPPAPPEYNLEPTRHRKVYSGEHDYPLLNRDDDNPVFRAWFSQKFRFLYGPIL